MTLAFKRNDKEIKKIDQEDENRHVCQTLCQKDIKDPSLSIKYEILPLSKQEEQKRQEEDFSNESVDLYKKVINLPQSPFSLQQLSKFNDAIELFPSQSNFQCNKGYKFVKTGQDCISLSEKACSQEVTTHNSSSFSPICYSDQQQKIKKLNNCNQYLNQSPTQSFVISSSASGKEKGLAALKKNLFVNSTNSSTPYSFTKAKENCQINEKESSPSSQKNSTNSKSSYSKQENLSPPSTIGIQKSNEKNNIVIIQRPEEGTINQQSHSIEAHQIKNIIISQNTKPFNCSNSSSLFQASDTTSQIINKKFMSQTDQTSYKFPLQNIESQQNSDNQNSNYSDNITNLSNEFLPYISFIQPELVLPGLGAFQDSLYTLLMEYQGISASDSLQNNFQLENKIDLQVNETSENLLKDLNQIDLSKLNDELFLTSKNTFIQHDNMILENQNEKEDEDEENNEDDQIMDFNEVFKTELNQILLDQEKILNLQSINNINKNKIGNEIQCNLKKGDDENQQQINNSSQQSQSTFIEEQVQKHKNIITQKTNGENTKKGFQISACHQNYKKGFQVREGMNHKKSLISQLKQSNVDQKNQQQILNRVEKVGKQTEQNILTKQSCMTQNKEHNNINKQLEQKQFQSYSTKLDDKINEDKLIIQKCNTKKIFKFVCHYKLKEKDYNQVEVKVNSQCEGQKLLQSKYKLLSPQEKSKLQIIDVKAIRFDEAKLIQEIKSNKDYTSKPLNQSILNLNKINEDSNKLKLLVENKNKEKHKGNISNEDTEQEKVKIEKNNKKFQLNNIQNKNLLIQNQEVNNTPFFNQSQDFNELIQKQSNCKIQNTISSPQTIKIRFIQEGDRSIPSAGKEINILSSSQALNTSAKSNHNYSNISLMPQQSSSILSNSFMDFNEENDSVIEQFKSELKEDMDKKQLGFISHKCIRDQKLNQNIKNKQYPKREKNSINNKKNQLISQTTVSKFKSECERNKSLPAVQKKQKMTDTVKINKQEELNIGRKRKHFNIKIKSFQGEEEKEIFEEFQNHKQITNKHSKNRKKVKTDLFNSRGCSPQSKNSQLVEMVFPDKYESYLNQIGNISRSNTISSQISTQPIDFIHLSKENSALSAYSETKNKIEKKFVNFKRNKKINEDILEEKELKEQTHKTEKSSINLQQQNDRILEEESSVTDSEKTKNDLNNSSKSKFDTKNLVKNFLNQFLTFVCSEEEEKQVMEILDINICSELTEYKNVLKNFFKNKKFNRSLLKEFIFKVDYRKLFNYFLENRATDWISQGRMKDKPSHFRALQNFQYICQNHDEIKSWRFRYNFV